MSRHYAIEFSDQSLNINQALSFVSHPGHGGTDIFIGSVRNKNLGKDVLGVSYEIYQPLARQVLNTLCEQSINQWGQQQKIYIAHFYGRLDVKENSLVIAVSTPHRSEAFHACRFLLEEIKKQCPIWKQEHYTDGESDWVKGHALCSHET